MVTELGVDKGVDDIRCGVWRMYFNEPPQMWLVDMNQRNDAQQRRPYLKSCQ